MGETDIKGRLLPCVCYIDAMVMLLMLACSRSMSLPADWLHCLKQLRQQLNLCMPLLAISTLTQAAHSYNQHVCAQAAIALNSLCALEIFELGTRSKASGILIHHMYFTISHHGYSLLFAVGVGTSSILSKSSSILVANRAAEVLRSPNLGIALLPFKFEVPR